MAPARLPRPRLRTASALAAALLAAGPAAAETLQTSGLRSAVQTIQHAATFDELATGAPLGGYTEDGLVIDVPDTCFCTGYHYPNGGSPAPTTISAAGGEKLVALEFEAWRSSEISGQSIYYWEAHEVWESLWHAAGRRGPVADFLKGLIKLAAAGVKTLEGSPTGRARHARRAAQLLRSAAAELSLDSDSRFMGLPVAELARWAETIASESADLDRPEAAVFPFQLIPAEL